MNRWLICTVLTLVLLAGFCLGCTSEPATPTEPTTPAGKPITLKVLSFMSKTHSTSNPVHLITEKIEKRTDGLIVFDWPGGPEVIPNFDQPEALKTGVIDAQLYLPGNYMSGFMPEVLAGANSPYTAWKEREIGIYDLWSEIIEEKMNCKYLGRLESLTPGFHVYTVDRPIKKIEDFKGLSLRVAPLYIPIVEQLGASPVTLEPTEVANALSRGVIDGMINAKIGQHATGNDQYLKYMVYPGFGQLDNFCLINLDTWNKIPSYLQDEIIDVVKDGEYICTAQIVSFFEWDLDMCKQTGMQIVEMEMDEGEKFLDIVYGSLWDNVLENAPENGQRLKELMTQ